MPYIGVSPQFGVRRKHTYTATAGQTSFSGAGSEGATLSYTDSNFVDVYQNGVKLGDADYTSTSGTAIVLAQGASVDDLVEIIVFDAFSAADTVSKADGGQFDGNITMAGTLGVTGATTLTGGVSGDVAFDTSTLKVDSSNNRVGIGTASPSNLLHIQKASSGGTPSSNAALVVEGTDSSKAHIQLLCDNSDVQSINFGDAADNDIGIMAYDHTGNSMRFTVNAAERMRINNDGNVLIGRTSELYDFGDGRTSLVLQGSGAEDYSTIQLANNGTGSNNQILGHVGFYDGTTENGRVQGIRGSSTSHGDIQFFTNNGSGLAEHVRIYRSGEVGIGITEPTGKLQINTANMGNLDALVLKNETNNVNGYFVRFRRSSNAEIGSIEQTGGGATVSYNTSSDYRLKENVEYTFDATTRLKQLKPARFNFIGDTATVDGFLAHEVSDIVPHAISGKKDATENYTDENGDEQTVIKPQGIDHSKLVPLLTKSLQEAMARIETLEAKVTALENAE